MASRSRTLRPGYPPGVSVDPSWIFRTVTLVTMLFVPLLAWRMRGRVFAIFGFVALSMSLIGAWVTEVRLASWAPPLWHTLACLALTAGAAASGLHYLHLVRARMRDRSFRFLVSIPGQVFVAASFMAAFWQLGLWPIRALLGAAGLDAAVHAMRWLDLAPYALAVISVFTSVRRVIEWVRIPVFGAPSAGFERLPVVRVRRRQPPAPAQRPLRIVQISDPHLGPWMSVRRMQRTLERLLAYEPDLVLLTGDFLTMEGNATSGALARALEPLEAVHERCFAIFGNHDHEAADEVRSAFKARNIRLLVDEEVVTETPIGPVQIIGADYRRKDRREPLETLLARHPRHENVPRLLLLHDPSAFKHVPDGQADLTLSGHTHGGQIGLVSFGFDWTVLSRTRWPDHGLFAQGTNRLYVHRGTGFYGFPLRVGVPSELSILELELI